MTQMTLDTLVEQALQLSAYEKLMLIERVSSAVRESLPETIDTPTDTMGRVLPAPTPRPMSDIVIPDDVHWGQRMLALLDTLDLSDWQDGPEDVVEYVRQMREKASERLKPYWDGEA